MTTGSRAESKQMLHSQNAVEFSGTGLVLLFSDASPEESNPDVCWKAINTAQQQSTCLNI